MKYLFINLRAQGQKVSRTLHDALHPLDLHHPHSTLTNDPLVLVVVERCIRLTPEVLQAGSVLSVQ